MLKNGGIQKVNLNHFTNLTLLEFHILKNNIISSLNLKNKQNKPLEKVKILDIGCGGGLLSEPMSRLGAEVVGIDASDRNISVAKLHAKKNHLKIQYLCSSPENLKIKEKFDVILNMEIIEHVNDVNFFLKSCSKLLKKDGIMFVATLNKTLNHIYLLLLVLSIFYDGFQSEHMNGKNLSNLRI